MIRKHTMYCLLSLDNFSKSNIEKKTAVVQNGNAVAVFERSELLITLIRT